MHIWGLTKLFQGSAPQKAESQQAAAESVRRDRERRILVDTLERKTVSLKAAVKSADIPRVETLIAEIRELDPDRRHVSYLDELAVIQQAVYQDNVALFNAVITGFQHDMNHKANWIAGNYTGNWQEHYSLFIFAIEERKPNIALALAKDIKTDVHSPWKHQRNYKYVEETAFDLAKERGLTEVAVIVADRMAARASMAVQSLQQYIELNKPPGYKPF